MVRSHRTERSAPTYQPFPPGRPDVHKRRPVRPLRDSSLSAGDGGGVGGGGSSELPPDHSAASWADRSGHAESDGVGVGVGDNGVSFATAAPRCDNPVSICRRTSEGDNPQSSAASVSKAWAKVGGQWNSARFAAALKSSRCRSPSPAPSRINARVERFMPVSHWPRLRGLRLPFGLLTYPCHCLFPVLRRQVARLRRCRKVEGGRRLGQAAEQR